MIEGGHPDALLLAPGAMLSGDAVAIVNESGGGDAAQADDDLGLHQLDLIVEVGDAGILLLCLRVTVFGRAALDDVCDIVAAAI